MEQALNGSRGATLAIFFRTIAGGFRRVVGGSSRPSIVVPGQRTAGGVDRLAGGVDQAAGGGSRSRTMKTKTEIAVV